MLKRGVLVVHDENFYCRDIAQTTGVGRVCFMGMFFEGFVSVGVFRMIGVLFSDGLHRMNVDFNCAFLDQSVGLFVLLRLGSFVPVVWEQGLLRMNFRGLSHLRNYF